MMKKHKLLLFLILCFYVAQSTASAQNNNKVLTTVVLQDMVEIVVDTWERDTAIETIELPFATFFPFLSLDHTSRPFHPPKEGQSYIAVWVSGWFRVFDNEFSITAPLYPCDVIWESRSQGIHIYGVCSAEIGSFPYIAPPDRRFTIYLEIEDLGQSNEEVERQLRDLDVQIGIEYGDDFFYSNADFSQISRRYFSDSPLGRAEITTLGRLNYDNENDVLLKSRLESLIILHEKWVEAGSYAVWEVTGEVFSEYAVHSVYGIEETEEIVIEDFGSGSLWGNQTNPFSRLMLVRNHEDGSERSFEEVLAVLKKVPPWCIFSFEPAMTRATGTGGIAGPYYNAIFDLSKAIERKP